MSVNERPSVFKRNQVLLVTILALAVCGFFAYRTLGEIEFVPVESGKGDYSQIQETKQIDYNNSELFKPDKNGSFEKRTAVDILKTIPITGTTILCLFCAILAMVGRDLSYMWRIRTLTSKKLSWKASFRTIMIWEYASALAPGVLSGATVAMFILNRERISMGKATAIVITTAFFDNLFFVIMIPIVFCFYDYQLILPSNAIGAGGSAAFWTGYFVFLVLCSFLFVSLFVFPSFTKIVLNGITKLPFLKRWNAKANETGENVRTTALGFKQEKTSFWAKIGLATVFSWTSRYLVISFIFQAFVSLGFTQHILLLSKQFVLWMFMRIAPTPGGSGVAEWAFGELLSTFSASAIIVGSLAVLWRLIGYFPYIVIGSILLPRWLGTDRQKLEEERGKRKE